MVNGIIIYTVYVLKSVVNIGFYDGKKCAWSSESNCLLLVFAFDRWLVKYGFLYWIDQNW